MGISKTMQEIDDEQKEREEAARDSALQAQMAEAQQQQEMEGVEEDDEEGQQEEEGGEGVLGRDLDEDIPDADQEGGWVDDDENSGLSSEEYDDDEGEEEEGIISQLQQQQGAFSMRPPGPAAAAAGLFGEYIGDQEGDNDDGARDLDEDIPEAGSYQHTDTEVEDESSFDGEEERGVVGFGIGTGVLQQQDRR